MNRRDYIRSVGIGCLTGLLSIGGCLSNRSQNQTLTETGHNPSTTTPQTTHGETSQMQLTVSDFRSARRTSGEPITGFDELESWKTTAGQTTSDTEQTYASLNSLELRAATRTDRASARYTFSSPQDFTNQAFSLAVKWHQHSSQFAGIWLTLYDTSDEYIQFSQSLDWKHFHDWQRVDLGIWKIKGEPNLDEIVGMELMTWAGDGQSHVWVADGRTTPTNTSGQVMLTFDDARASQYSVAYPIMEQYGFAGGVGVITESLGQSTFLDLTQLEELYASGWDMYSHPQYHERPLTEFSRQELNETLKEYKQWLLAHGFQRGANCIIYPFGRINDHGLDIVAKYHKLGFKVAGQTPYSPHISSPLLASRITGEHVQDVKHAITLAGEYGLVVPIMYHALDVEQRISKSQFKQTMEHIAETQNVTVITPAEWLRQIEPEAQ